MRSLLLYSLLFLVGSTYAQSDVGDFKLDEHNGEVFISITVNTGYICNGIDIFRSSDSISFEKIGGIQGYCGSANEKLTYDYTDHDPVINEKSYYRIDFKGIEETEAKSITVIDLGGQNIKIKTNPVVTSTSIIFKNPLNKNVRFELISMQGKVVYEEFTQSDIIELMATSFDPGPYLFAIREESGQLIGSGKLLFLKP